jgi:hypothetical protein
LWGWRNNAVPECGICGLQKIPIGLQICKINSPFRLAMPLDLLNPDIKVQARLWIQDHGTPVSPAHDVLDGRIVIRT